MCIFRVLTTLFLHWKKPFVSASHHLYCWLSCLSTFRENWNWSLWHLRPGLVFQQLPANEKHYLCHHYIVTNADIWRSIYLLLALLLLLLAGYYIDMRGSGRVLGRYEVWCCVLMLCVFMWTLGRIGASLVAANGDPNK